MMTKLSKLVWAFAASLLLATTHAQQYVRQSSLQPSAGEQIPPVETQLSVEMDDSDRVVQTVSSLEDEMIGYIDWENNTVYAVGDGVPPANSINPAQARVRAKRAAIDEAFARLLETIKEVRVDAESTTRNFINENRVVQTRVSGLVKHAQIVELRQADDGSYQIKMSMPMDGPEGINAALLPVQINKIIQKAAIITRTVSPNSGTEYVPVPKGAAARIEPQVVEQISSPTAASAATTYTGLIVDARGLNASPAAFPRILERSGEILYDLTKVDPNAAVSGMCVYKKSLEAAKQLSRAGSDPLVVKAVDVAGKNRVDLVLNDQDAKAVMAADTATDLLRDGQVIVILD